MPRLMEPVTEFFHMICDRAERDHSLRTDIPERLSTTLHRMLAAVTRYAVGLVYRPEGGFDEMRELETLREMLIMRYTVAVGDSGGGT